MARSGGRAFSCATYRFIQSPAPAGDSGHVGFHLRPFIRVRIWSDVFPDPPRQGIEITQNEYGKRWPFAVPQRQLRREGKGAIILKVRGVDYAINGMAANRYASIQAIWKKDDNSMEIGPIISRGLTLCKW